MLLRSRANAFATDKLIPKCWKHNVGIGRVVGGVAILRAFLMVLCTLVFVMCVYFE